MTPDNAATLGAVRRALFWLFIAGAAGIAAELVLSRHYEDFWQLVPLGLLGASLPLALACTRSERRRPLEAFRVLMVLFLASGIIGTFQHYGVKQEFALERTPDLGGLALVQQALKGINPPLLAPGAMMLLAAIGLVWTYALTAERDRNSPSTR